MNILRIMMDKDVFLLLILNQLKFCYSLFMSEESLGTTRVRKGTPGSFPLGILTPTIPCWIEY